MILKKTVAILTIIFSMFLFSCKTGPKEKGTEIKDLLDGLKNAEKTSEKIEIWLELSDAYKSVDRSKSIEYANQALNLSSKEGLKKEILKANNAIGEYYSNQGDYKIALEFYKKNLEMEGTRGLEEELLTSSIEAGIMYLEMRDIQDALDFLTNALPRVQKLGNKKLLVKCYAYIGLIEQYQSKFPEALEYYNAGLKISRENEDKNGIMTIYHFLGGLYFDQSNYTKSLDFWLKCLKLAEELDEKEVKACVLSDIGLVYQEQNNPSMALDYCQKSMEVADKLPDRSYLRDCCITIGNIYFEQKDYKRPLQFFFRGLKISEQIQDTGSTYCFNICIGETYRSQGKPDDALEYFSRALQLKEKLNNKRCVANSFILIGKIQLEKKNFSTAKEHFFKALTIAEEQKAPQLIVEACLGIGRCFSNTGEYSESISYLLRAVTTAEKINRPSVVRDAALELSRIFSRQKNYENAYRYFVLYHQKNDSLKDEEKIKRFTQLEMQHTFEKQQQRNELEQKKKDMAKEAELKKQRILRYTFLVGFILMFGVALFIYRSFRVKQRINRLLIQNEIEIASQAARLEQANRELEKLTIVARETDNAVLIMDKDGYYEWINEGFTRIFGNEYKKMISEKGNNLLTTSANSNIKEYFDYCIQQKKSAIYETFYTDSSGKEIWVQTTLTPILDAKGNVLRLVAIDTDITRIKNAEKEIKSQRDELHELNITKDKFFSIIAHDLKNPFSTLLGFLKTLTQEYDNFDKEEVKELLGSLHKTSENTYNLLENLLFWSRTQTGAIKCDPASIDISQVIRSTVDLYNKHAQQKKIRVQNMVLESIFVLSDPYMTHTIMRNIISNAIKFTREGGYVSVEAGRMKNMVEIRITDTGIGISESEIKKLFRIEMNYTRRGTSGEEGTGLGLILSKELVEQNGGKIRVESVEKKGSTFIITLPAV